MMTTTTMSDADLVPLAIDLGPQRLQLQWADGLASLAAVTLRTACRCADCKAAALQGRAEVLPADLRLVGAAPVGHYALQLVFSDGHDRGIYPWSLLRALQPAVPEGS
jgi:DUF971 family protein